MSYRAKQHGPRYNVKGKSKSWVERDGRGRFKDWIKKKNSLAVDIKIKADNVPSKPGMGNQGDY